MRHRDELRTLELALVFLQTVRCHQPREFIGLHNSRVSMTRNPIEGLDEIDRNIIRILSDNPREPYTDLASKLGDRGFEMTSEGVRNRVQKLLERTSVFFLLTPEEHGWEIVRFGISVDGGVDSKASVYERLASTDAWLICRGVGDFDLWAVGTVRANKDVDALVTAVREIEHVDEVYHFIETGRRTFVEDYLSF